MCCCHSRWLTWRQLERAMSDAALRAALAHWRIASTIDRQGRDLASTAPTIELVDFLPENLCIADSVRFRFFLASYRPSMCERLFLTSLRLIGRSRKDNHARFRLTNRSFGAYMVELSVPVWLVSEEVSVTFNPPLQTRLSTMRISIPD